MNIAELAADQLDTLDMSIIGVECTNGWLKLRLDFGEVIFMNEQDLATLLNFLVTNKKEKDNG